MKTTPPPPQAPEDEVDTEPRHQQLLDGRYELMGVLGEGGMGVVYRAVDRELDELLAVKLLQRQFTINPSDIERFKREIKTARRITHPNVIRIHHFGVAGGEAYICMELLPGGSLAERIADDPIPIDEGLNICLGIARGLAAAHTLGVIHRDIKPHNVMFDGNGTVKILDFGIARFSAATSHTQGFVGTPHYISPEQADGGAASTASDVYSMGILMYEVFTGKTPFESDSLAQLILMHVTKRPGDPRSLRPALPEPISEIILRCLEKHPGRRYADAGALADALAGIDLSVEDWQRDDTHYMEGRPADRLLGERYEIVGPSPKSLPGRLPGRDLDSRRDVTIRIVPPELLDAIDDMEVIRGRLMKVKALSHPNICPVEDLVVAEEGMAIVTERLDGESLESRLRDMGQLPVGWALRILQDIARALAAAHSVGIVHGRLDASRVVLHRRTDEAIVLDFGLAAVGTSGLTDPRNDVYALGLLAVQIVTGRVPRPDEAAAVVDALPSEVARLAGACLHEDPSARPADGEAALRLLEARVPGGLPGRPDPVTGARRSLPAGVRRGVQIGVAAAVAVVLVVLGVYLQRVMREGPRGPSVVDADALRIHEVVPHGLESHELWLTDALEAMIQEELVDAYGLRAEVVPYEGEIYTNVLPPDSYLTRNAAGRLDAKLVVQRGTGEKRTYAGVAVPMREFVIRNMETAIQELYRDDEIEPSPQRMALDGAQEVESWRNWRRAQRASMLGKWPAVARLGALAMEDPGFPLGALEASFAYDTHDTDPPYFKTAARRADRHGENLDVVWVAAVNVTRMGAEDTSHMTAAQVRQRGLTMQRTFDDAMKSPTITRRQILWAKAHWLASLVEEHDARAETFGTAFQEEFPNEAAPYLLRAAYYVYDDDPRNLEPNDLEHGIYLAREAVQRAPHDVGIRAVLGRALVLQAHATADRAAADLLRREAELIVRQLEAADNSERRDAARDLFHLYMALGDRIGGRKAIILAKTGTGWQPAEAIEGLALLDCWAGNERRCLNELNKAARVYNEAGSPEEAGAALHALAWGAYTTERYAVCDAAFRHRVVMPRNGELVPTTGYAKGEHVRPLMSEVIAGICRDRMNYQQHGGKGRFYAAEARTQLAKGPPENTPERAVALMLVAFEEEKYARALELFDVLAGESSDPVGTYWWAARSHEELGNVDKATDYYARLAKHPLAWRFTLHSGEAWYRYGTMLEKQADASSNAEQAQRLREEALAAYDYFLKERAHKAGDTPEKTDAARRARALQATN